jgi:uncharacterized protein YqhQ
MTDRLPSYGGQALIEGVMMRGGQSVAAAMRAPDGSIVTKIEDLGGIYQSNIKNIPFLRGLVLLWDALGLGMRFLTDSANVQTGEDEKLEGPGLYLTLGFSILLAVGLFFIAPAAVAQWIEKILGWNAWVGNLVEGVIRLLILIGYIWGIGRLPDIARVFAYHGAEHKTINAYEAGAELTPENIKNFSVEHPRCGTAFLLTVMVLSILLFSLLGPLPIALRLISRVLMIPVLAGIAYEYTRWTAAHLNNPLVKILVRPNLALQHLTTREPDLKMLEVALTAFNKMLEQEESKKVPIVG